MKRRLINFLTALSLLLCLALVGLWIQSVSALGANAYHMLVM